MSSITYQRNDATRTVPNGFSWTTFFFGIWPSVFRGHVSFVLVIIAMNIGAAVACMAMPSIGILFVLIAKIIVSTIRNDQLHNFYIRDGWRSRSSGLTFVPAANDQL